MARNSTALEAFVTSGKDTDPPQLRPNETKPSWLTALKAKAKGSSVWENSPKSLLSKAVARWRELLPIYRYGCFAFLIFLAALVVFIPLFITFALPRIISSMFANAPMHGAMLFQLLKLIEISEGDGGVPESVGFVRAAVNLTQPFSAPLNIAASIGPTRWTISLAVPVISEEKGYVAQSNSFFQFGMLNIPSSFTVEDSFMRLNEPNMTLHALNPSAFTALNRSINSEGRTATFPLGTAFLSGICNCLMSGQAADVPQVLLQSSADISIGPIFLPNVPLVRIVNFGQLLVDGGKTFPSITPATSSDPSLSFQFVLKNTRTIPGTGKIGTTVDLTIPQKNYAVNPITAAFTNLSLRLNVSSVPLARVESQRVSLHQGNATIEIPIVATPLGNVIQNVAGLLFQDFANSRVGVDQVSVRDVDGKRIGWISDLCDALVLQVPLRVFSDSSRSGFTQIFKGLGEAG
ncbi:hypothetical protein HDU77_003643 [Chytriomyces hyalinus]|nr:hypothetical protein HDU77_003643 [Chytriomyces hyalinus]